MSKCGKCGTEGHNVKTCPQSGGATKKVAKPAKSSPASARSTGTVMEALVAEQKELQRKLAVVDRVLNDLNAIGIA
jgi:hypothetical protein